MTNFSSRSTLGDLARQAEGRSRRNEPARRLGRLFLAALAFTALVSLPAAAGDLLLARWRTPEGNRVGVRVEVVGDQLRLYAPRPIAPVRWAVLFETPSNRVRWELYNDPPPAAPDQPALEGEAWVWQGSEWRQLGVVRLPARDTPRGPARR